MLKRLLVAAAFGVLLAGCTAAASVNTTPDNTAGSTTATTAKAAATVGSTLSLTDQSGAQYTVTLLKVVDPATPADSFNTAPAGDNLAEVLMKITGVKGTVNDDADLDVTVTGSDDQSYSAGIESLKGCTDFNDGDFVLAAGQSLTGCVAIEIKKHVTVTEVDFAPDGGFGTTVGEWKI